jgi:hypothetical protein
MWSVEAASAAFHIVELQRPIEPLPEVGVLDGHHLPEELPPPIAAAPFGEPVANARPDIIATVHKRYPRRLIERLQRPDDRQQIKPFDGQVGLGVVSLKPLHAILAAEHELPLSAATAAVDVRDQMEVWRGGYHRLLSFAM